MADVWLAFCMMADDPADKIRVGLCKAQLSNQIPIENLCSKRILRPQRIEEHISELYNLCNQVLAIILHFIQKHFVKAES
jgi:hypothetical protein